MVDLSGVHTVVLDEADEMLNMGFLDSIDEILSCVPADRKMLMFSATMPNEIARIARKYMHEPTEFRDRQPQRRLGQCEAYLLHGQRQGQISCSETHSRQLAQHLRHHILRTRRDTQEIADKLIADGYNAEALHGDLSQQQRDIVMRKFRDGVVSLLVATDVAARGLDVDDLTHVINYGLPDDPAVYTHRSGRTGRAGKTGVSIAIIHSREKGKLREIEKEDRQEIRAQGGAYA